MMLGRKQINILVIKTDSLSGFIAAEPAFENIRQHHDQARISLLTIPSLQRIARASSFFDQVAAMPNLRDGETRKQFVRQLKATKFERVYDLSGDESGRRLHSAMGLFRPKWFMASPSKSKMRGKPVGSASADLSTLFADAGLDEPARLPNLSWAIEARKDSANMKPAWYGVTTPFGLLLPGLDESRRWSAAGYARLASLMAQTGYMPVLAGPKELHGFGDMIAHDAPQVVDLAGKTDHLQLAALAREAAFFVSDDAEEMQLAVSVGCQGVMIAENKNSVAAPTGRHVVTLRFNQDPDTIEPEFIWRALTNMGLTVPSPDQAISA